MEKKKYPHRGSMFEDLGLVFISNSHALGYGWGHGWFRWAPMWSKRFVVHIWNWCSCRIFEHWILDLESISEEMARNGEGRLKNPEIRCNHCSKRYTREEYNRYKAKLARKKSKLRVVE
jgi:hypothetical protein